MIFFLLLPRLFFPPYFARSWYVISTLSIEKKRRWDGVADGNSPKGGKRCFSDNLIVFRIKSKKSAKVKSWLGWEKLVYESEYCITKFHKFSLDGPLDGVSRSSPPSRSPCFSLEIIIIRVNVNSHGYRLSRFQHPVPSRSSSRGIRNADSRNEGTKVSRDMRDRGSGGGKK